MERVLVVGMSGSGKTTAARAVAARAGLPFHEMDVLAIGPGWSTPPGLTAAVETITGGPRWVIDSWGYPQVRDRMWATADTVLWLDYPRRVVLPRLLLRSLRRSASRRPVFAGNRERWRDWTRADHPLWHAVRTFGERRAYLLARTAGSPHLRTVRFRSPTEWIDWLERLA